jgi:hypothetical protein
MANAPQKRFTTMDEFGIKKYLNSLKFQLPIRSFMCCIIQSRKDTSVLTFMRFLWFLIKIKEKEKELYYGIKKRLGQFRAATS